MKNQEENKKQVQKEITSIAEKTTKNIILQAQAEKQKKIKQILGILEE